MGSSSPEKNVPTSVPESKPSRQTIAPSVKTTPATPTVTRRGDTFTVFIPPPPMSKPPPPPMSPPVTDIPEEMERKRKVPIAPELVRKEVIEDDESEWEWTER